MVPVVHENFENVDYMSAVSESDQKECDSKSSHSKSGPSLHEYIWKSNTAWSYKHNQRALEALVSPST